MKRPLQGRYVKVAAAGEAFEAFVPAPLPPKPAISWNTPLHSRFDAALLALGRLDAVTDQLPNASLVLYSFVRKEAVLSSMIEGTQSSLADLMLYELDEQPGVPEEDAQEVSRYVSALEHGLKRLRGDLPLSQRLICEVHKVLLGGGRGSKLTPGEFRRSQVWIGGTRPGNAVFVPPPANEVPECFTRFERFLHDDPNPTPSLVKAALAHVQFETIHPFLDGNGRVGRLLIALQLASDGLLRQPLLYISYYFKQQRRTYYELLNRVRETGDWETWLEFFADAISSSATQAVSSARRLLDLSSADAQSIEKLGRAAASALAVHRSLQRQPLATSASLVKATGLTPATVNKSLAHLERLGIVTELTSKQRGRVFNYARYIEILNEGMELPDGRRSS
ncbi:MAG TPA: Fic family protein [Steroidobacteraceae bacterium]|nr:Fic family protein [Steroidobacteraceae bacterium]